MKRIIEPNRELKGTKKGTKNTTEMVKKKNLM